MLKGSKIINCGFISIVTGADPTSLYPSVIGRREWFQKLSDETGIKGIQNIDNWDNLSDDEVTKMLQVLPALVDDLKENAIRLKKCASYNKCTERTALRTISKLTNSASNTNQLEDMNHIVTRWSSAYLLPAGPK